MSYKFSNAVGVNRVRRYLSQVIGGLGARSELASLEAPFEALRLELDALRAAREAVDDAILRANARLRVFDADWDAAIQRLSSRAYEVAGKKAANEPYATLFGKIDARRARGFGAAKAALVGTALVKDGRRVDAATELTEVVDALDVATNNLISAKTAWDLADDALFQPRADKKKFIAKLNLQIAIAEAGILTVFPGRGDLVSAVLTPWFQKRRAKNAEPDDDELDTPDLDEDEDDSDDPTGPGAS